MLAISNGNKNWKTDQIVGLRTVMVERKKRLNKQHNRHSLRIKLQAGNQI